jgi:tetratricopeptide (TPR) repeat protein
MGKRFCMNTLGFAVKMAVLLISPFGRGEKMKRWISVQISHRKLLVVGCFLFFFMILSPCFLQAEPSGDDQAFLQKKASVLAGLQKEEQSLASEKARLEKERQGLAEDIEAISGKVPRRKGIATGLATGFGLSVLFGGFFSVVAYVVFPLAVVNHFLYLLFREKAFFTRYRKPILIILAALLVACLLPLLASAQTEGTGASGGEGNAPGPFEQKLGEVNRLMKMSPAERQIALMEHAREGEMVLQKIPVKDPYLIPSDGKVETGSPDFLYTLAALYRAVGKEEKVLETLKRLDDLPLQKKWFDSYLKSYPRLLEMDLKNNQIMEASRIAHRLIEIHGEQGNTNALMDFSVFLNDHQMSQSANEAIGKATQVVGAGQDALDLTDYLLAANRVSEASALLGRIIAGSENLKDLLPVLGFCMEKGLSQETSKAIEKAGELCKTPGDDVRLSQFLFEKDRKEESAKALSAGKERAEKLEDLLSIAQTARGQGFLTLAIEAIERAVMTDPRAAEHHLPSPLLLGEKGNLPTEEPISLATYLGIMQELDRRMESAQTSYKVSPEQALDRIAESYGQIPEGNLNDFFYLKQFWARQDPEQLKRLLPLYARLQEKALERVTRQGKEKLSALKEEIRVLKEARDKARQNLKSLRSERNKATMAVFLYALRGLAWTIFGILVVAGCVIKAVRSFRNAPRFKFYAFWWRFQESLGWSLIMGIVLIPVGLCLVLWGQLMAMLQSVEKGIQRSESRP